MPTRPLTPDELRSITPRVLPVDPVAEKYGLPAGMKVSTQSWDSGGWRCVNCEKMQSSPEGVYISDGIKIGDSLGAITEDIRRGWWQGHSSKWCIPCVRKLVGVSPSKRVEKPWYLVLLAKLFS